MSDSVCLTFHELAKKMTCTAKIFIIDKGQVWYLTSNWDSASPFSWYPFVRLSIRTHKQSKRSTYDDHLLWWSSWLLGSRLLAPSWSGSGSSAAGRRSKGSVSSSRIFPLCTLVVSLNSGHCSYECTVPGSSERGDTERSIKAEGTDARERRQKRFLACLQPISRSRMMIGHLWAAMYTCGDNIEAITYPRTPERAIKLKL